MLILKMIKSPLRPGMKKVGKKNKNSLPLTVPGLYRSIPLSWFVLKLTYIELTFTFSKVFKIAYEPDFNHHM